MGKILSLPQQIYDFIVDEIRYGNLAMGQKINENDLVTKLLTSRTPIREALIQLSADGILDNVPRKGFFVKSISPKTMLELNAIIACLDFYALKKAIPLLREEDYRTMEAIIENIESVIARKDYYEYCILSDNFHRYYHEASQNEALPSTITDLENRCMRHTFFNEDQDKLFELLAEVNQEHRKILELAKANNLPELESLLNLHWTKLAPGMW